MPNAKNKTVTIAPEIQTSYAMGYDETSGPNQTEPNTLQDLPRLPSCDDSRHNNATTAATLWLHYNLHQY